MTTTRFALAFALLAPLFTGCAAPVQNGGVVMSPHAEARLDILCRYRSNDPQNVCAQPAEE